MNSGAKDRLVVMVVLLLPLWACQGNAGQSSGADSSAAALQPVVLNADEYRQEISEIDRLAFEAQPLTETRREALAIKLEELARGIKAASDSRFIAIEEAELQQLAAMARSGRPDPLHNHWMRIRNNVFDDRSWFARSAADLEAVPPGAAAPSEGPRSEPPPSPTATSTAAPHDFEGRWRVRAIYGNGRFMDDPELSNAVWRFDGDQLSIQNLQGVSGRYTFTKIQDDQGTALRLESHGANGGRPENGWMIYQFGQADLKLAFFDGLGDRPESFVPPAGRKEPMFVMVILLPEY